MRLPNNANEKERRPAKSRTLKGERKQHTVVENPLVDFSFLVKFSTSTEASAKVDGRQWRW